MKNIKKSEFPEIWMKNTEKCKTSFDFYIKKELIKQEQEKEYLSNSHLKKADYNLDFLNFLFDNKKFYDWIIVGCYYSIYHSALALLAKKGYSSKNHLATLCALIHLYYKENLDEQDIELISRASLEKQEVSYFVEAKEKRETASYGISQEFNKSEAQSLRDNTISFVNKVKRILEDFD
jgi:uncharacterized protein (UPF0332 family)